MCTPWSNETQAQSCPSNESEANQFSMRGSLSVSELTDCKSQFTRWLMLALVQSILRPSWRWSLPLWISVTLRKPAWAEDPGLRLTRSPAGRWWQTFLHLTVGHTLNIITLPGARIPLTVTRFLIKPLEIIDVIYLFFSQDCFTQWDKECMLVSAPWAWLSASRLQSSLCKPGHSF